MRISWAWERHQICVLLLEGVTFTCPWTHTRIDAQTVYHLDHIVPVAIRPINELWNLVPSDPRTNAHDKRGRLPSADRLARALPHLAATYRNYDQAPLLARAIHEDVGVRFTDIPQDRTLFPNAVARAAVGFIEQLAVARNLARF